MGTRSASERAECEARYAIACAAAAAAAGAPAPFRGTAADSALGEHFLDVVSANGFALDARPVRFLCGLTSRLGVQHADGSLDRAGFLGGTADMIECATWMQAPWLEAARRAPREVAILQCCRESAERATCVMRTAYGGGAVGVRNASFASLALRRRGEGSATAEDTLRRSRGLLAQRRRGGTSDCNLARRPSAAPRLAAPPARRAALTRGARRPRRGRAACASPWRAPPAASGTASRWCAGAARTPRPRACPRRAARAPAGERGEGGWEGGSEQGRAARHSVSPHACSAAQPTAACAQPPLCSPRPTWPSPPRRCWPCARCSRAGAPP